MASPIPLDRYGYPKEIRDRIFEELYHTCLLEHRQTAAYASVCSEWQEFFEAKHFERLTVKVSQVSQFGVFVVRNRRHLVKHIRYDFPPLAVCCSP